MNLYCTAHTSLKVLPVLVCILGALFYCHATIIEITPNNIVNQLMASFHLTATQISILSTGYFTIYALCLIPGGIMLDYYGECKILSIAMFIYSTGILLFALMIYFPFVYIARIVTAVGGSFGLLSAMFLTNKWMPKEYLGLSLGFTVTIGQSGGLLQQPLALAINAFGWRMTLVLLSGVSFLLTGLMYLTTRKLPAITNLYLPAQQLFQQKNYGIVAQQIMQKPANWILAIYGGLMFVPTGILGTVWGISFLQVYYPHNSKPTLAGINSLIFLGWIIGSPLLGLLSDQLKQRRLVVKLSSIILCLVLLMMTYLPHLSLTIMGLLMLLIGICSAGGAMFFTMTIESNHVTLVATALGFINALALIPNILFQPIFGFMLDSYATKKFTQLTYSLVAYQHAFNLLLITMGLAVYISWFYLKETHPYQYLKK